VPAHDQRDPVHRRGQRLVLHEAEVRQDDDVVHALGLEPRRRLGQMRGGVLEADRLAGRGQEGGVGRRDAEDTDLHAVAVEDQVILDEARQRVACVHSCVARDDGELGRGQHLGQRIGPG
jgi:hypothetical protein